MSRRVDSQDTPQTLVRLRNEHYISCSECSAYLARVTGPYRLLYRKIRDGLCQTGKKLYDLVMRADHE